MSTELRPNMKKKNSLGKRNYFRLLQDLKIRSEFTLFTEEESHFLYETLGIL